MRGARWIGLAVVVLAAVLAQGSLAQLAGTWVAEGNEGNLSYASQVILFPNGTFAKVFRARNNSTGDDYMTRDVGHYSVGHYGGENYVHFNIQEHWPMEHPSYPGKRLTPVMSETWFFQVLDNGRVLFEDRTIGQRWIMYRSG